MSYYPQNATGLNYITYPVGPTANVTYPAASGSTNTKGSYTQMAASSAFTCNMALINFSFIDTATPRQYLYDIATGAAASEVVVISNLIGDCSTSTTNSGNAMGSYSFPLKIAASTRIAARLQCSTGSTIVGIAISLIAAGGVDGITSFTTYGDNTADSGGTSVDPGGTADTKGSYSQITASTSAVTQSLALGFGLNMNSNPQNSIWAIDIATGAGGAEVVLFPDLRMATIAQVSASTTPNPRSWGLLLTYIAASTRIAIRSSCLINDATDRLFDVIVYAGVAPSEPAGTSGGAWAYA